MNILRDNETLTGEKALRNMSYFLILKLLEPHFDGEINIDDYDYDFSHIEDEMIEKHKNKLLEIVRFSNLSNEKDDNIPVKGNIYGTIFYQTIHYKKYILKGKGFDIEPNQPIKN